MFNKKIKKVITIGPDAVLEEAATLMRNNEIGCLPVTVDEKVIGIITANDIFDAFINMLGYKTPGSRYVINVENNTYGVMASIAKCFADKEVNITNISTFYGPRGIEIIIITNDKDVETMKKVLVDAQYDVTSAEVRN